MTSVDRVKSICKTKNIPISRLERDLGFANGYIGQLKKGVFPDDRLVLIARYLGVSVAELTGEQNKKPTTEGEPDEVTKKLYELIQSSTHEVRQQMLDYMEFMNSRKASDPNLK